MRVYVVAWLLVLWLLKVSIQQLISTPFFQLSTTSPLLSSSTRTLTPTFFRPTPFFFLLSIKIHSNLFSSLLNLLHKMAERRNYWTEYTPSLIAAIIVVITFAILTIIHLFKLIRTRTWFCVPLVIGGLCKCFLPMPRPKIVRSSRPLSTNNTTNQSK